MNIKEYDKFKQTLDQVEHQRDAAFERVQKQRGAGRPDLADHSMRAYLYCRKYAEQLRHILDGYVHEGARLFTKNASCRYKDRPKV